MTEDREQMTEDREQMTEDSGQKTETEGGFRIENKEKLTTERHGHSLTNEIM